MPQLGLPLKIQSQQITSNHMVHQSGRERKEFLKIDDGQLKVSLQILLQVSSHANEKYKSLHQDLFGHLRDFTIF